MDQNLLNFEQNIFLAMIHYMIQHTPKLFRVKIDVELEIAISVEW
jgi:hypothetical protein